MVIYAWVHSQQKQIIVAVAMILHSGMTTGTLGSSMVYFGPDLPLIQDISFPAKVSAIIRTTSLLDLLTQLGSYPLFLTQKSELLKLIALSLPLLNTLQLPTGMLYEPIVLIWVLTNSFGFQNEFPRNFILWMAIRGKIRTKHKPNMWGITDNSNSLLCNQEEYHSYLLLTVLFPRQSGIRLLFSTISIKGFHSWHQEMILITRKFSGKSFQNVR